MLRSLHIRDFVIVDRFEQEFEAGFGALTGETGAGKSILIDALSLALGDRADASVVRSGAERAEISAEFSYPPEGPVAEWLKEADFPDEGGVCLLRRVVDAGGRSRAYINGSTATLTQLRELGEYLADIHGQHAHHALLKPEAQRQLLDAHAGQLELVREVGVLYREWRAATQARVEAEKNVQAMSRERELLDWQVKELVELDFDAYQWQETNQEHRRLAHGAALLEGADATLGSLDEGQFAAVPVVEHALARVNTLVELDPQLLEARDMLAGAAVQLEEAVYALRRYRDRLELDPARLAEVEGRIEAVTQIARKHRTAPEALPALLIQLAQRQAELSALADPVALAEREAEARAAYLEVAGRLSAGRGQAAQLLSEAVTASMQELSMAGGRFEAALVSVAEGSACGQETVEFRVAANPQQPLRPLAKVASGGELSRIGLSIQVITSRSTPTETLIFDEVDVGIGGRVAEIVGRLLRQLGCERQVMCVTHLPQVAAQANWQWSIAKADAGQGVRSQVTPLDRSARIEEIARMLGGVNITDTTRRHAAEMLGY